MIVRSRAGSPGRLDSTRGIAAELPPVSVRVCKYSGMDRHYDARSVPAPSGMSGMDMSGMDRHYFARSVPAP
jgi:hypothetical protein